ncbi:MAG TPA: 2Fe-2S iron-sulfur cluster binding domain-containing protein [Firmicutes bacterium]|jgi:bidirectional [NiFe] hydrogenase diaphorase subunit|nr:2Fe-2S iron-sulfur cluster binding domain-containing protein [Bacillota bacterium]
MGVVNLTIDDLEVKAEEGMTVLEAAQSVGIDIPTLCHHDKLQTYTACRICMVEVEARGRIKLDTACSSPVRENMVVKTRTERIMRIRKTLLELMLAHAPDSRDLQDYANEYGADRKRFEKMSSFCIHCGLCVRYCAEVKKKSAVVFVGSGVSREISFVPEVASKECWNCKECFELCPTEALQAAYVLSGALITSLPTLAEV